MTQEDRIPIDTIRSIEIEAIAVEFLELDENEYDAVRDPQEIMYLSIIRQYGELVNEINTYIEEYDKLVEDIEEEDDINITDEEEREGLKQYLYLQLQSDFFQYLILCSTYIEQLTKNLLEQELIEEEYRGTSRTNDLFSYGFGQRNRNDLLKRSGVIDEELHDVLEDVRSVRSKIIHEIEPRITPNFYKNIVELLENSFIAINRLRLLLNEDLKQSELGIQEIDDQRLV